MKRKVLLMALFMAMCIGNPVDAAFFSGLGPVSGPDDYSFANGVADDGSVIVGFRNGESMRWTVVRTSPFIWINAEILPGFETLANHSAHGVSGDGAKVVGGLEDCLSCIMAYRWSETDGLEMLGRVPSGLKSIAEAATRDGSIVVGYADDTDRGFHAVMWTGVDEMTDLGTLAGDEFSKAFGVSADGKLVAGVSGRGHDSQAFLWTPKTGMLGLGFLPGCDASEASDVAADGKAIVGMSESAAVQEAFRWTPAEGMRGLGDLAGGSFESKAHGVSADGSVVVGGGNTKLGDEAFIWTAGAGRMAHLETYLRGLGLGPALEGWTLSVAYDLSADGQTIVGMGINPAGHTQAWIAYIGKAKGVGLRPPSGLRIVPIPNKEM
jgi:probable HAF family extracellular repeat protein